MAEFLSAEIQWLYFSNQEKPWLFATVDVFTYRRVAESFGIAFFWSLGGLQTCKL